MATIQEGGLTPLFDGKKCGACGDFKSLDDFHKDRTKKDGHGARCKSCRNQLESGQYAERKARWKRENRARVYEHAARWRRANPDKVRAIAARSYLKSASAISARNKAQRQADPSLRFRLHLKEKFKMTLEQYQAMAEAQGGLCAICENPAPSYKPKLCVDHDHEIGVVRGLLCDLCNRALGLFREDADVLQRAVGYLARSRFLKAA